MHRVASSGSNGGSVRARKEKKLTYVLNDANDTQHCAGVNCLDVLKPSVSTDQTYLFTGSRDGTLKRWAFDEEDKPFCSATFESHVDWVNDAALAGDTTLVSCSSDTTVKTWDSLSDGVCTRTLRQHSDYVTCLAVAAQNSNVVASGGLGGEVFIWDIEAALSPVTKASDSMEDSSSNGANGIGNSQPVASLRNVGSSNNISVQSSPSHGYAPTVAKGHKESVYALAMNDSGTTLVSGGTEKVLRVWDPRTGSKSMKLRGHTDNVRVLLLDSTGRFCLSGSSDSMIRLWDLGQQRCLHTYAVHTDSVWALACTPSFNHVYSGGRDQSLYLTDLGTRESVLLCTKEHPIQQLALQDESIWVATTDSSVERWPAEVQSPQKVFQRGGSFLAGNLSFNRARVSLEGLNPPPAYKEPSMTIPGSHPIVQHEILNNKRQILTKDAADSVKLWNITKGVVVEDYGKVSFEEKKEELFEMAIADTMSYMAKEGTLLRGEHNILGEAFLVMASSAGAQQQQEVLSWLLEPLSQQWIQSEWQNNYLSDPTALVRLCSNTSFMWSIYHTVTFFEKALKRSGYRKSNLNTTSVAIPASHPMDNHLSWMLPPLIKLLRVVHALWSPSVRQTLPPEMRAAMTMTDGERNSLLGEPKTKSSKGASVSADGPLDGTQEGKAEEIRNWLKGIRESGYNVLGLSTTIERTFFTRLDANYVVMALMENFQWMDFRHLRLFIHSFLTPAVKSCPKDMWEPWLRMLLHPLFIHCQQALSSSWTGLLREGRAKVPDSLGVHSGSDMKLEVMEENLLRDLTREIATLFLTMASPSLNTGVPSPEYSSHVGRVNMSTLTDLHAFKSNSIVGFLLTHKSVALPALQICLEVFTWTEAEATNKVCSFCGVVLLLAILTNNVELREFVAKDLFSAVIRGLGVESNAIKSPDLVNLCREIFINLCDRDPAPRQVLLSLPCLTPSDLHAFEEAAAKHPSPNKQKQLMGSLLMLGTGNNLKALAAQKSLISPVSLKDRGYQARQKLEKMKLTQ